MLSPRLLNLPTRTVAHVACALAITSGVGAAEAAASGQSLIADCVANRMQAHYTAAEYSDALANLPDDVAEYTECPDTITEAQRRDAAGAGAAAAGGASGGSGTKPYFAAPATGASAAATDGAATAYDGRSPAPVAAAEDGSSVPDDAATGAAITDELGTDTLPVALRLPSADAGRADGSHAPMLPIVAVFVIVVLGITRMLLHWGRQPERISGPAA